MYNLSIEEGCDVVRRLVFLIVGEGGMGNWALYEFIFGEVVIVLL